MAQVKIVAVRLLPLPALVIKAGVQRLRVSRGADAVGATVQRADALFVMAQQPRLHPLEVFGLRAVRSYQGAGRPDRRHLSVRVTG